MPNIFLLYFFLPVQTFIHRIYTLADLKVYHTDISFFCIHIPHFICSYSSISFLFCYYFYSYYPDLCVSTWSTSTVSYHQISYLMKSIKQVWLRNLRREAIKSSIMLMGLTRNLLKLILLHLSGA